MKKMLILALCAIMTVSFAACGNSAATKEVEGDLADLVQQIYDNSGLEMPLTETKEITEENVAYYLGTDQVEYAEGVGSEAMISSIPHSLVLLRLPEGADIEAAKKLIKENVDPRKWICVGVDESNVVVDNIGHLVVLIMNENSAALHDAFLKLAD